MLVPFTASLMPRSNLRKCISVSIAVLGFSSAVALAAGGVPAQAGQCFACHGSDGIARAPDAPNLAGQNEIYLVKALKDFRSGARVHEVMSLMAKNLTDTDIDQLAAYFSGIEMVAKSK